MNETAANPTEISGEELLSALQTLFPDQVEAAVKVITTAKVQAANVLAEALQAQTETPELPVEEVPTD